MYSNVLLHPICSWNPDNVPCLGGGGGVVLRGILLANDNP